MPEYVLLHSETLEEFNCLVNEKLSCGWQLYGSPTVRVVSTPVFSRKFHYQALTRAEDNDCDL